MANRRDITEIKSPAMKVRVEKSDFQRVDGKLTETLKPGPATDCLA